MLQLTMALQPQYMMQMVNPCMVVHLISRVLASTAVHASNRILVIIQITWTHNVTLQFEEVEKAIRET